VSNKDVFFLCFFVSDTISSRWRVDCRLHFISIEFDLSSLGLNVISFLFFRLFLVVTIHSLLFLFHSTLSCTWFPYQWFPNVWRKWCLVNCKSLIRKWGDCFLDLNMWYLGQKATTLVLHWGSPSKGSVVTLSDCLIFTIYYVK